VSEQLFFDLGDAPVVKGDQRIAEAEALVTKYQPYSTGWWSALRNLNGICVEVDEETYQRETRDEK
jgi:hypothetical protein